MRRWLGRAFALLGAVALVGWVGSRLLRPPARPAFHPADPLLRAQPLYFYPAAGASRSAPRAVVFFFGNDVGFWRAHQELAERLAGAGYGVVGFDMRPMLARLPESPPAARDSAFLLRIAPLVARSRRALGGTGRPLVLGGHSVGAELALWTAARLRPSGLVGVLALSPGVRGHLRVTLSDIAEGPEPTEAGSFAVAEAVRALAPAVPVAVVRGASDKYGGGDAALVAAGAHRFVIPFAGHALRRLLIAGPVIESALAWLVSQPPASPGLASVRHRDGRPRAGSRHGLAAFAATTAAESSGARRKATARAMPSGRVAASRPCRCPG